MIEFEIKGKVLRLTNTEWRNIQNRFNPANAVHRPYAKKLYIRIPCKLCAKYKKGDGNCTLCPFLAFAEIGHSNGCLELLEQIFPQLRFVVNVNWVSWASDENSDARRQLNSIQKRMKKIEESQ